MSWGKKLKCGDFDVKFDEVAPAGEHEGKQKFRLRGHVVMPTRVMQFSLHCSQLPEQKEWHLGELHRFQWVHEVDGEEEIDQFVARISHIDNDGVITFNREEPT